MFELDYYNAFAEFEPDWLYDDDPDTAHLREEFFSNNTSEDDFDWRDYC